MPTKERIIPLRKKCDCGKAVKNHHWLCDKCYGKKQKRDSWKRKKQRKRTDNTDIMLFGEFVTKFHTQS